MVPTHFDPKALPPPEYLNPIYHPHSPFCIQIDFFEIGQAVQILAAFLHGTQTIKISFDGWDLSANDFVPGPGFGTRVS
jgi:hypothetical protein